MPGQGWQRRGLEGAASPAKKIMGEPKIICDCIRDTLIEQSQYS